MEVVESTAPDICANAGDHDATLVTGLDVGLVPGDTHREDEDQRQRTLLQGAGIAFQVVYGQGDQRLRSALRALRAAGVLPSGFGEEEDGDQGQRKPWTWVCDKCSDPSCEHRLFTQLRDARSGP